MSLQTNGIGRMCIAKLPLVDWKKVPLHVPRVLKFQPYIVHTCCSGYLLIILYASSASPKIIMKSLFVLHMNMLTQCILLIQVKFLIYFMLKYAMKVLVQESTVITSHYFNWNTSSVALFVTIIWLTLFPINAVVGTYINTMFEDMFIFSCV